MWTAGGGKGDAPFESVTAEWDYFNLVASLIQGAGPNLNPALDGSRRLPDRASGVTPPTWPAASRPGNYSWNQDMRLVYWSPKTTSKYNARGRDLHPGTVAAGSG